MPSSLLSTRVAVPQDRVPPAMDSYASRDGGARHASMPASTTALIAIAVVAFLLRVGVVLWIPTQPVSDFWSYIQLAKSLLDDGTYAWGPDKPTAMLAPGYPFLLAAVFALFGTSLAVAKAVNVVLSTATVVLGGLAARTLLGPAAAIATAALLCVDPRHLLLTCLVASENLGAPALLAFLWLLGLSWRRERAVALAAVAGFALGVSALARPVGLYAWLLWPVCGLLVRKDRRRVAVETVVLLATLHALLLSWGVRNQIVLGRFITSTTTAGVNLFMGNNDAANGSWMDWRAKLTELQPESAVVDEAEVDAIAAQEGRRWILAHPLRATRGYIEKLALYFDWRWSAATVAYWSLYTESDGPPSPTIPVLAGDHWVKTNRAIVDGILTWTLPAFLVLGLVGGVRLIADARRGDLVARASAAALLGLVAYFPLVTAIFIVVDRYRWPLLDVLTLLAGLGIATLVGAQRETAPGASVSVKESLDSRMADG